MAAFTVEEGDFVGYRISSKGYKPSPYLTISIEEFPRPADKTGLQSFNGLCQQVGLFSKETAAALAPFSPLLKKQATTEHSSKHVAYYRKSQPGTFIEDAELSSAFHVSTV